MYDMMYCFKFPLYRLTEFNVPCCATIVTDLFERFDAMDFTMLIIATAVNASRMLPLFVSSSGLKSRPSSR